MNIRVTGNDQEDDYYIYHHMDNPTNFLTLKSE